MDTSPQEALTFLRWLFDAALGGGLVLTFLKLRAERRLREAQAESEEAEGDKFRAEAHRSDIGAMSDVIRTVREQWSAEREDWHIREKLLEEQMATLHAQHRCDGAEIKELKERLGNSPCPTN